MAIPSSRRRWVSSAAALLTLIALVPATASAAALPDGRGWELVSPVEKNGGSIAAAGQIAGGGVLQASLDGNSVTYGSAAAFGAGAQGAPAGSQYLSSRSAAGWATANITVPIFSGSYGLAPEGVPYQLFSPDLSRALLLSGRHCRSAEGICPVANPPLAGTDAPAGYQNYYLRQGGGGFQALLGSTDLASTEIGAADFGLTLAGTTPDLEHVVLESCAALTPYASEVPLGEGCDLGKANLYEWSSAAGLDLVNTTPGAALAAQSGAISTDGSRVYWRDLASGNLYLREGTQTKQVDATAGGGGTFQTATPDGSVAFFTKEAHLWRYLTATDTATDLTPAGGVVGVLGVSDAGSDLYYLTTDGLYLLHISAVVKVAAAPDPAGEPPTADPSNYPPATGTARVSADGTHLLFISSARLTGYDNRDQKTGLPDSEVFFYDANGAGQLRCVSCRPNGTRPVGPSSIPGAIANGGQATATDSFKPRVLSVGTGRVFFDSRDVLIAGDSNNESDVYEWEAQGPGCVKVAGCVALISSGRAEGGAAFVDASASGNDAFFITDGSLVGTDPGSVDLYDARVGGGFPEPLVPIPCSGDSCQNLPSEPVDPALSTQVVGPGNPKVHYVNYRRHEAKRCKAKKCHKQGKGRAHAKKHGKGARHGKKGGRR